MDPLNFNKEQTVVLEGHCLPDIPLARSLFQHKLNEATITQMAREVDPKKKLPCTQKNETYGIYGYCDFQSVKMQVNSKTPKNFIKRLILRTDNDKANDLSVKLRRSLLKRCQDL